MRKILSGDRYNTHDTRNLHKTIDWITGQAEIVLYNIHEILASRVESKKTYLFLFLQPFGVRQSKAWEKWFFLIHTDLQYGLGVRCTTDLGFYQTYWRATLPPMQAANPALAIEQATKKWIKETDLGLGGKRTSYFSLTTY